jgi:hypothetical protein
MPRLLGHATYMAALVGIIRSGKDLELWVSECPVVLVIVLDLIWFHLLYELSERLKAHVGERTDLMRRWRNGLYAVGIFILLAFPFIIKVEQVPVMAPMLAIIALQSLFGILVNVRGRWYRALNPEDALETETPERQTWLEYLFPRKRNTDSRNYPEMLAFATEKRFFVHFNLLSSVVFCAMIVVWVIPHSAPYVGAFAIVWLSISLLIGFFNLVAWLTNASGVPIVFGLVGIMFVLGRWDHHHRVSVLKGKAPVVHQRNTFEAHWAHWQQNAFSDTSSTDTVPIVFVLADGGASRSGYWVGRIMERLHRSDPAFSEALFSLSGASGGAVGLASYYQQAGTYGSMTRLDTGGFGSSHPLQHDMLSSTLAHMLGPDLINLVLPVSYDRAHALELALERSDPLWGASVRELFERSEAVTRPILCLNTTCMGNGLPGVVSSVSLKGVSKRIDILDSIPGIDMHLSTAAVLSSRFPYISPAGHLSWGGRKHYFVDGGYFDNSGAGATLEMLVRIEELACYGTDHVEDWFQRLKPIIIHISNTAPYEERGDGGVHVVANDVAAPLLTVLGTYASQTNINDERLKMHIARVFPHSPLPIDINLYEEASQLEFSMNWSISKKMLHTMDSLALRHPAVPVVLRAVHPARSGNSVVLNHELGH